jgi:hypothetical protein
MKQINLSLLFLISIFFLCDLNAVAIFASDFNRLFSCANPFVLRETTTIFMDEDIVFTTECLPFVVSFDFLPEDQLIFTSLIGARIIVMAGVNFDIKSILPRGQQLVIKGNSQLIFFPGSRINLNNNQIICMQKGKIVWLPNLLGT